MPLPHIVLVVADDLGYHMTGYDGSLQAYTPSLDALVDQGIHLTRVYGASACSPARHALLMGRLPNNAGMTNVTMGTQSQSDTLTSLAVRTIAQRLKDEAGYRTHAAGKWGVGLTVMSQLPLQRGFESYMGYLSNEVYPYTHLLYGGCMNTGEDRQDIWYGNDPYSVAFGQPDGYNDELHTDHIVRVIEDHDPSQPLFALLALQNPHSPYETPPERYVERIDWHLGRLPSSNRPRATSVYNATVYQMGAVVDDAVANVTAALQSRSMWATTLLVFTSDNGGPAYEASNYPLRGWKFSPWEGGLRVTSFVAGGLLPASVRGTKLNTTIHLSDWYATFCELAGIPQSDEGTPGDAPINGVDGLSLWPLLSGGEAGDTPTETRRQQLEDKPLLLKNIFSPDGVGWSDAQAIVRGRVRLRYKLMRTRPDASDLKQGPIENGWSAQLPFGSGGTVEEPDGSSRPSQKGDSVNECKSTRTSISHFSCLFDIWDDPRETTNLIDDPQYATVVSELAAEAMRITLESIPAGAAQCGIDGILEADLVSQCSDLTFMVPYDYWNFTIDHEAAIADPGEEEVPTTSQKVWKFGLVGVAIGFVALPLLSKLKERARIVSTTAAADPLDVTAEGESGGALGEWDMRWNDAAGKMPPGDAGTLRG